MQNTTNYLNLKETKEMGVSTSSRNIIMSHLSNFIQDNNLEAVVSDYTDESILITQDATFTGPEEIKTFFAGLMVHFPNQQSSFVLDKLVVKGELAFIVWHATTPSVEVPFATDTFVIKNGKILQQTFAGQLNFIK